MGRPASYTNIVNLRINDLPPCKTCGSKKTVIRTAGRITVYCPNCDDISPKKA